MTVIQPKAITWFERAGSNINWSLLTIAAALTMIALGWMTVTRRSFIELRRMQIALRESQANLTKAQRIAGVGSWVANLKDETLEWSAEEYRLLDLANYGGPLTINALISTIYEEDRAALRAAIEKCAELGEPFDLINRILLADGSIRWLHERGEPIYDEHGNIYQITGTTQDITEHKKADIALQEANEQLEMRVKDRTRKFEQEISEREFAERLLKESEERFQLTIDHINDGVFYLDLSGMIVWAN